MKVKEMLNRFKILFIFFVLLISLTGFSQNQELADVYALEAEILAKQDNYLEAVKMYKKSIQAEKVRSDPRMEKLSICFLSSGNCYYRLGQYNQAIKCFEEAMTIYIKTGKEKNITACLNSIGLAYKSLGQYNQAIYSYKKALSTERKIGKKKLICSNLYNIGNAFASWNKYDKAIEYYKESLTISQALEDKVLMNYILNNIRIVYGKLDQYDQAIIYYKKVLVENREQGNKKNIAILLNSIGLIYHAMEQYTKELNYFKDALAVYQNLEDEENIAKNSRRIKSIYRLLKQPNEAINYFKYLLDKELKRGNKKNVVVLLTNIGMVYKDNDQHELAIKYFNDALMNYLKLDREADIADVYTNIGLVYKNWGRYEEGLESFKQALSINRKLNRNKELLDNMHSIRLLLTYMGQFEQATEYHEEALACERRLNPEINITLDLRVLGHIYHSRGNFDQALKKFTEALSIDRRDERKTEILEDLLGIGGVYNSWGQVDSSSKYIKEALELGLKFEKDEIISKCYSTLGNIYFDIGEYHQALKFYLESLAINRKLEYKKNILNDLLDIGILNYQVGKYNETIKYIDEAISISRDIGAVGSIAIALNIVGKVHESSGIYHNALKSYNEALGINRELQQKPMISNNLFNIGHLFYIQNKFEEAIPYFTESIDIIEEIRKTAVGEIRRDYLASQINSYQFLASSYIKLKEPVNVFNSIEISRSKLLSEKLTNYSPNISTPQIETIQKEIQPESGIIIYANTDWDNIVEFSLTSNNIQGQEILIDEFLKPDTENIKQLFNSKFKEIRDFHLENDNKDNFVIPIKKSKNYLENYVNCYRKLLISPSSENQVHSIGLAQAFYNLLIKPHHEYIKDKKELIIIPDGILAFLPFETLIDEEGYYLAEKYNIKYTHSMGIWDIIKKRQYDKNRKPILAFGGAVYDEILYKVDMIENDRQFAYFEKNVHETLDNRGSVRKVYGALDMAHWQNLPGTLREIQNIRAIIPDANIITGDQVTENNVKEFSESGELTKYKVLHFATHGLTLPELPELSALVLSQFKEEQNGEDGYLRMGEIAELNIQADFVNLSACETGLGKIYGGEGVVGLTQSFLIAGANALSVSLWNVADESTSKFMTTVYKLVKEKGMNYSEAMTEVKRQFIRGDFGEKYKSPFYWAPFVYYGN